MERNIWRNEVVEDVSFVLAKDVNVIINYVTGAGPQGMLLRKTVRIFRAYDSGFIISEDLMNDVMKNTVLYISNTSQML